MTILTSAGPGITRRGLMLIVSSPSGAGKTTLTRSMLQDDPHLTMSVSVTTRARRSNEVDGVHYHFISRPRFDAMAAAGDLLECADVHGNGYGTPREPVEAALQAGRDVLFDIDWQGTSQLYQRMAADIVSVFILPPSIVELRARLERRAEDTPEVIARRLTNARREMAEWRRYDYVIVNKDLDASHAALRSILAASRLNRHRQVDLDQFVEGLRSSL